MTSVNTGYEARLRGLREATKELPSFATGVPTVGFDTSEIGRAHV
jgi:hypothetical protein